VDALANNLQVLFQGLALGSIYALVALGFVLIIRATNVVNFAQGDFAMLGGYAMILFLTGMPGNPELHIPGFGLHVPYVVAVVLSVAVMALIGIAFNYGVYYPLRNRSFLPVLISTLGASIFLQNSVLALFNPQPRPLDKLINIGGFTIASAEVQAIRSTHCAREGPGSNGSPKYWVSLFTFPSSNSMMLTV